MGGEPLQVGAQVQVQVPMQMHAPARKGTQSVNLHANTRLKGTVCWKENINYDELLEAAESIQ